MDLLIARWAPTQLSQLIRNQSGQGMAEYASIIVPMVVFGFFIGGHFLLPVLLRAVNMYLDTIYFILNAPLP
jgi:hypothetical protein